MEVYASGKECSSSGRLFHADGHTTEKALRCIIDVGCNDDDDDDDDDGDDDDDDDDEICMLSLTETNDNSEQESSESEDELNISRRRIKPPAADSGIEIYASQHIIKSNQMNFRLLTGLTRF